MTDLSLNTDHLLELVGTVCNKGASENDFVELNSILLADEVSRRRYLNYCRMHASLRLELRSHAAAQKAYQRIDIESGESAPGDFTVAMDAPSIIPFGFLSSAYHGTIGFFSQELPFSLLIATVLTGLGLWCASMIYVSSPEKIAKDSLLPAKSSVDPTLKVVGKITGMVDCKWADPNTETFHGANVLLGRKYAMASGLMEITYGTGAKVILQGPVTYEVESKNGGFLPIGKLTGKVENDTAKGFTVRTPTAIVTDLGTEFGIEVNKAGDTTSHVFRGSVEVQVVAADGKVEGNAQVLHENQSARVENNDGVHKDKNCVTVFATPAKSAEFVREIPRDNPKPIIKKFDLVDVVAGGNGFSGRRNRGIDPTNGRLVDGPLKTASHIVGDGKYHRVDKLLFIDGVFIPNGRTGPVQVDSAGHVFAEIPNTNNETVHCVWAGGAIPVLEPTHPTPRTELEGINYASSGHGLLFLHSNKGITFDLDAIRRANPESRLTQFRAVVGNTENVLQSVSEKSKVVYADAWVLVDGHLRFRRWQINNLYRSLSGCNSYWRNRAFPNVGGYRWWKWHFLGLDRVRRSAT